MSLPLNPATLPIADEAIPSSSGPPVNNYTQLLFSVLSFSGDLTTLYIPNTGPMPPAPVCAIIPGAIDDCATVPFIVSECYPENANIPSQLTVYYYNDPITYNQVPVLTYLKGPLPPKPGSPAAVVYSES